jgi:L-rhamnose isomerase / sugar isomerase
VAYAKALHIDFGALEASQAEGDVLAAHRVYLDAYATDVRPLLRDVRRDMDVPEDPIGALRESGIPTELAERRGTHDAGGGYPSS